MHLMKFEQTLNENYGIQTSDISA